MDSVAKAFAIEGRMEKPMFGPANVVDIDQILSWANSAAKWESDLVAHSSVSAFPVRDDLNEKVSVWAGDITVLNTSAVVNIINDGVGANGYITQKLMQLSPTTAREVVNEVACCRIGEAVYTSGYGLPSKYVIHTVAPKYSEKYKTAAENSLLSSYRAVFDVVLQNNISSIALPPVHTRRLGYPEDLGADVTARFLRNILESHGDNIKKIVLVLSPKEKESYEMILPIYLPRNAAEEAYSVENLRGFAPTFSPDRLIRITDNPQQDFESEDLLDEENNLGISVNVGKHAFSQMEDSFDRQRLLDPSQRLDQNDLTEEIQRRERYERLLRQCKVEDLTAISGIGCLYQSGYDKAGRPVVICIGKWMNYEEMDLEKLQLHLIKILEPIIKGDYVVVYFHTQTSTQNHPPMAWMKDIYETLQYRHKKNLKAFYIVHPTFWTRVMTWWFLTFMAPAIKQKVVPVYGVEYLHEFIDPEELNLPMFIAEHDMRTNGIHYHQSA